MIQRQPVPGISTGKFSDAFTAGAAAPELVAAARFTVRLGRCTARLVPRLATAAMQLSRIEGWKMLRCTCANDFARERLDRSGSWLRQLARLGRACQEMPVLVAAITGEDGDKPLGRAAAYEICRVARPDNVVDWIQRARNCTIRDLKEMIRRAQDTGASIATTASNRRRDSLKIDLPVFLRGALLDIERVFQARNPGSRRQDLLEALTAEHASGDSNGMTDVDEVHSAGSHGQGSSRRLHVLPGRSGFASGPDLLDIDFTGNHPEDKTTNRELLKARWTLYRVQMFVKSIEAQGASTSACSAEHLEQSMRDILALEHEVKLRIDHLLLWLDDRRAWSLLGFADAAEFGQKLLGESTSTTRNRLRLARALERSTSLRRSAESGRLSHQRLVRLVQLMEQNLNKRKLSTDNEAVMHEWVDHSVRVELKRLDEDLDAVEARRWSELGRTSGPDHNLAQQEPPLSRPNHDAGPGVAPTQLPPPPTDAEWQASLSLVPGDARRRLLLGGLRALATEPTVNVCHRFTGGSDTIRDLRHAFNLTRVRLADQARRLVVSWSPADESRLFPSIRLAARRIERGTPIPDWICLLSLLEEFVEEWDNPRNMPRRPTDAIASRDGWRCTAPGCTSREIEVHHIIYRSRGGSDDPSNLTSLCPFHHRMGEHGGLLKVTGTAPLNLRWQMGDRVYRNERLVEEGSG